MLQPFNLFAGSKLLIFQDIQFFFINLKVIIMLFIWSQEPKT